MPQQEALILKQKITGVLLRQARQDAGKSLKECGQVLGLSSGAISAIERGKRAISLPELEMLAYYLSTWSVSIAIVSRFRWSLPPVRRLVPNLATIRR